MAPDCYACVAGAGLLCAGAAALALAGCAAGAGAGSIARRIMKARKSPKARATNRHFSNRKRPSPDPAGPLASSQPAAASDAISTTTLNKNRIARSDTVLLGAAEAPPKIIVWVRTAGGEIAVGRFGALTMLLYGHCHRIRNSAIYGHRHRNRATGGRVFGNDEIDLVEPRERGSQPRPAYVGVDPSDVDYGQRHGLRQRRKLRPTAGEWLVRNQAQRRSVDRGILAAVGGIVRPRDLVSPGGHDGPLARSGFGRREDARRCGCAGDSYRRTSRAVVQCGDLHFGRASDLPWHLCIDLRG